MKPVLVSALAYAAIAAVMGRNVLAAATSVVASDPGDPLLTSAILAWNAHHIPWTEAWYQFPIFYPTRDALAFSEHLLGATIIFAPIERLTGSPPLAYNLTLLLSYPLCGLAMYGLIFRLTRNSAAAFLSGLAYAFAPYRTSQLPHIQMLLSFWMPLALLGLHAYLDTRRWTWLALFAVSWLLQGASNGYYLIYFSLLIALWLAWFLAFRGRWRDLAAVACAGGVALLPLVPVLFRYVDVQRSRGLSRSIGEVASYSADIAAVFCAPPGLTFWGWLRVACGQEAELFAGAALIVLCLAGYMMDRRTHRREPRHAAAMASLWPAIARVVFRVAAAMAVLLALVTVWTIAAGPWRIDLGWLRASASSAAKPLSLTSFFLFVALLTSQRFHDLVRRGSASTFYLLAAAVCWVLAWGPFPRLFGEPMLYQAPYAWLLQLPGASTVRAPARLWMLSSLCLIVYMGLVLPRLLDGRRTAALRVIVLLATLGLAADGWTTIRAAAVPPAGPARELAGKAVLSLPAGEPFNDIASVYRAVTGGYRAINGYSGYEPPYYEALRTLSDAGDDRVFTPLAARGDLHVLVSPDDALWRSRVERQPGARRVSEGTLVHYLIPHREVPASGFRDATRLAIAAATASCSTQQASLAVDGRLGTKWGCGGLESDQSITVVLRMPADVGRVVIPMGTSGAEFGRNTVVDTSLDGETWTPAWEGSPAAGLLQSALAAPYDPAVFIEFSPRAARYVRLRQTVRDERYFWSIPEIEIFGGESRR